MGDNSAFLAWLTSPAPPAWIALFAGIVFAVKSWDIWKARWQSVKAGDDEIAGNQIERLVEEITRHSDEIKDLKAAEALCREELVVTKERLAQLEGYHLGRGDALNQAQRIVSEDREEQRYRKGEK